MRVRCSFHVCGKTEDLVFRSRQLKTFRVKRVGHWNDKRHKLVSLTAINPHPYTGRHAYVETPGTVRMG